MLLEHFYMLIERFNLLINFESLHHFVSRVEIHLSLVQVNRAEGLKLEELLEPLIKLIENGAYLIQAIPVVRFALLDIALQLFGLLFIDSLHGADAFPTEDEVFLKFLWEGKHAALAGARAQGITLSNESDIRV